MNKPTMKAEINELFKTQFSVFDTYEKVARVQQIEKVMYIQDIAEKLGKTQKGLTYLRYFPTTIIY